MKFHRLLLALLVLVMAGTGSSAWAHSPRTRIGVHIGVPIWGPWYPSPYYYPPQVVVVPAAPPPVYIEQNEAPPSPSYWYYCNSGQGYYPYVKECPEGWQKVLPQPEK